MTPMVSIKNPTDKNVTIWWGTDPYIIAAGHTIDMPKRVWQDVKDHNDYKVLEDVTEYDKTEHPAEKPDEPKPEWEAEGWDCTDAPMDQVKGFAAANNLTITEDESEDDVRDKVYEFIISKM